MDCYFSNLKVENNELYGRRWFRDWEKISPEDILDVREYISLFEVRESKGLYRIGVFRQQFDDVIEFVEDKTEFRVKNSFVHLYNQLLYRTPIFGRKKKR